MAKKPQKPEADSENGEAPKKKGLPKMVLFGGAGAAVLLIGGGAAWFFLAGGGEHGDGHGGHGSPAATAPKEATFLDLPDMTINLSVQGERAQFLRLKIALEVADKEAAEKIKPMMPRVLDTFQTYLREVRPADLQGSAGVYRLREELTRRVNVAVAPGRVDAVLFKEILVQ